MTKLKFIFTMIFLITFFLQAQKQNKWRINTIEKDPDNHGPDGISIADFNKDGLPDFLVPFEEGGYSKIYFHPGYDKLAQGFNSITIPVGGEDAACGDVDMDGHIDIIIFAKKKQGLCVFFNPGVAELMKPQKWIKMTLDNLKNRWPLIVDIDKDGHNEIITQGGNLWKFDKEKNNKREAESWNFYELPGFQFKWPMNVIPYDVDKDGDLDLVMSERTHGLCYLEQPNSNPLAAKWPMRKIGTVEDQTKYTPQFIAISDIDQDGKEDFVITYKSKSDQKAVIYYRTNITGYLEVNKIILNFNNTGYPRGVNIWDYDNDNKKEIFILAMGPGDELIAKYTTDPLNENDWNSNILSLQISGKNRKKMDMAIHCDVDGDGDMDVMTTEENNGWGVIWFENPLYLNKNGSMPLNIDYKESGFTKLLKSPQ